DSNINWAAKPQAQFASYRAIVIGDFHDQGFEISPLAAAVANVNTWAGAVSGNVFLGGGDAEYHASNDNTGGGQLQIKDGVDFAALRPGHTGLYFAFGNYSYSNSEIATILNGLAPGFTVTSQGGEYNVV